MSFKSHQLLAMKFKLKISKEALLPEYGSLVFLFPFFFFFPSFCLECGYNVWSFSTCLAAKKLKVLVKDGRAGG